MNSEDSQATPDPSDSIRPPELGLFERIYEWYDVVPWAKLTRTLRMAGSPTLVLLTWFVLGVWLLGQEIILSDSAELDDGLTKDSLLSNSLLSNSLLSNSWLKGLEQAPMGVALRLAYVTSPTSLYELPQRVLAWRYLVGAIYTLLLWTPLVLLLLRQGGLLTSGRPMASVREGLMHAVSRMHRAWLLAIIPAVCVTMISLMIFCIAVMNGWLGGVAVIETTFAVLVALVGVFCGLLAFGSHFAVPFGWAALILERSPDPLDSLSRGYEYLFRRPLHLTAYLIFSLVLVTVITVLASGVASAASLVAETAIGTGTTAESLMGRTAALLVWLPVAVAVTLGWGLLGGVYLLLRCDAGGQEVEDIWMPSATPPPPFPQVPNE